MTDVQSSASRYLASLSRHNEARLAELRSRCSKRTFDTEAEADRRLHEIRQDPKTERVPIRSYECSKCTLFHLTSWPKQHKPKPWETQ